MKDDSVGPSPVLGLRCDSCGGDVAASLLSCPSCHRLIHAGRLKELAASAENAERAGDPSTALASWQEAITLLPSESRQHAVIADRISRLGRLVESQPRSKASAANLPASPGGPTPPASSPWSGGVISGAIGTMALAIWKFKFLAAILITKGKFLLLGLTKASTFWSMIAAFGVYWTVFGAWFALGFVLSIYIHEMGHVRSCCGTESRRVRRCSFRESGPSSG